MSASARDNLDPRERHRRSPYPLAGAVFALLVLACFGAFLSPSA